MTEVITMTTGEKIKQAAKKASAAKRQYEKELRKS